jgi:shikimate kinase
MGAEQAVRPLLSRADPLAELQELAAARESGYLQANHTVSTEMMSLDEVVATIVVLAGD